MTDYNIKFDQLPLWPPAKIAIVEDALYLIGRQLAPLTGLDPVESINAVMGELTFRFTKTLDTWASSLWGIIRFRDPDKVEIALIVHELMHRLNVQAKLKPEKQYMKDNALFVGAALWPGMHTKSMVEGHQPDEGLANLLADYMLGMLDHNEAGERARAWVDAHMPEWVAVARER